MVKFIIDLVINIITITITTIISVQFQYNSFDIFISFLFSAILSAISGQSIGHLLAITFGNNAIIDHIVAVSLMILYAGAFTKIDDLFVITRYLTKLNPVKETFLRITTHLYGSDMCPSGQSSAIMSDMGWNDDLYYESLYLLVFQSIFFTSLAYICLKFRTL